MLTVADAAVRHPLFRGVRHLSEEDLSQQVLLARLTRLTPDRFAPFPMRVRRNLCLSPERVLDFEPIASAAYIELGQVAYLRLPCGCEARCAFEARQVESGKLICAW